MAAGDAALVSQYAKQWNIRVRPEYRVQVSPTQYRVPDVCVFERTLVNEPVLTHAPVAVFEVMSPEDRMLRMLVKLKDYELSISDDHADRPPNAGDLALCGGGRLVAVTKDVQELPGGVCSIDWRPVREFLDD